MTLGRSCSRPADLEKTNCRTVTVCGRVPVGGIYECPPGTKGSLQPTPKKKLGSSVLQPKDQNPANNLNEPRNTSPPLVPPDAAWPTRLATLVAAFQSSKQRLQLSCAHSFSGPRETVR